MEGDKKNMKLLTKELEARFKEVGSQQDIDDPIVIAKFFNPTGAGYWFATEYDSKTKIFYGYVSLFGDECDEWGDFSLEELETTVTKFGLGIERDLYFEETKSSEIIKQYTKTKGGE